MADPALHVLVVEDNPGDARLVEWALAHEPGGGFTSEHAGRVAAAIERVATGAVGAVLLDLGLPDSRGMDGLRRVRAAAPSVPVIVLTGSEDPALVRQALLAGAQDYQVKGIFPPGHLAEILRGAARRQRLELQLAGASAEDAARLVGAAEDALALIDPPGKVHAASPAFLDVTGLVTGTLGHPPPWLAEILTVDRPASPSDPLGIVAGAAVAERAPGELADLEYVVRSLRAEPGAPKVLRVRAVGAASAPRSDGSDAPIDEAVFAQLKDLAGDDPTFVDALVDAFLAEADPLVRGIEQAAIRGDAPNAAEGAHRLKSAAAQVGAMALSRTCGELEREARAGHLEEIRALARSVVRQHPRVAKALAARRTPKSA
jgi:DNA-binding NarL/FixJ family response regulator/HPt (histidine-containing phosphotransfer) domain-containing protein